MVKKQGEIQKHVRIPKGLYEKIAPIINDNYVNFNDFANSCFRRFIEQHERNEVLKRLVLLKGSIEQKPDLTVEERDKIFEELTEEKSSEILRKYGLD